MKRKQRILLALALTLVLAFGAVTPAHAEELVYGDTVAAGEVVERDILLVGRQVSIAGTVIGNVVAVGNQVIITGTVDGSLLVLGQNIHIGGRVTGGVYASALTVDLGQTALLSRDLNTVAVSITADNGSEIGRDLNAIGLDSGLNGHVARDLHTAIGPIQLYNGLMRLLGFDDLTLELHFESPTPAPTQEPEGNGSLTSPRRFLRIATASPSKTQPAVEEPAFDWGAWGLDRIRLWGSLFALGLLALWLGRLPLERSRASLRRKPGKTLATGLLVLIIASLMFVVGMLIFALVFALGLGLNFLGLWQLTFALWIVAFCLIALAMVALWLLIVYGSKIVIVYTFATWSFERIGRKGFWLDALGLLVGTLVYILLVAVPFIGWIVAVLVTAWGLGVLWTAWRERKCIVVEGPAGKDPAVPSPASPEVKG
ncbi:MAG: polymer-forming cytoskeletal protein [Anaerolineales bacterium]|nr:polymer-forming cytoskeletal protein [Anaerolineales bacterium]